VANILPQIEPSYVCLPERPDQDPDWPFCHLPKSARVLGTNPGQLKNPKRANRKEGQLRSMIQCIWRLVPTPMIEDKDENEDEDKDEDDNPVFTIVDFGGGSGHLGIPLALLFPKCRIIVVDLRKRSLELMEEKARIVAKEILENHKDKDKDGDPSRTPFMSTSTRASKLSIPSYIDSSDAFTACGTNGVLDNLFTFHGPVEQYVFAVDIALALHLCGEATDVTMRKAAAVGATAMVLAPCCVGKLSQKVLNPNIYHATGQNTPTITYPQSTPFCQLIPDATDWDALVRAADYSNEEEARTNRNATRRTAKALLETDRRLFLEEKYNYKTALMRMDPWEVTPKNDILVAWKQNGTTTTTRECPIPLKPDLQCQQDISVAWSQLIHGGDAMSDCSDWTREEMSQIQGAIQNFLDSTDHLEDKMEQAMIFPVGMGKRKRKLIHFCAGKMDLAHWCEGNKDSEKTVAVARRGRRRWKKQDPQDDSLKAPLTSRIPEDD
jgi:hypothetical protein